MVAVGSDPRLAPLLAGYVRGDTGAVDVLRDALLERSLEPIPAIDDPGARLECTLALLALAAQTRVGCASTRRVLDQLLATVPGDRALDVARRALGSLEATPGSLDVVRHDVFAAWLACRSAPHDPAIARLVWAVWMLLRELPIVALRTLRAIDPAELEGQIDLVARALDA